MKMTNENVLRRDWLYSYAIEEDGYKINVQKNYEQNFLNKVGQKLLKELFVYFKENYQRRKI